jgi:hypothetical protein
MARFHTLSLGDEPSYQAVKAPSNPLSAYAFFFKVWRPGGLTVTSRAGDQQLHQGPAAGRDVRECEQDRGGDVADAGGVG